MNQLLDYQKSIKIFCTDHEYLNSKNAYILTVVVGSQNYQIRKSKSDFQNLHKQMSEFVFELEEPFTKKIIGKQSPQETKDQINVYVNNLLNRLDAMSNQLFLTFFQLKNSKRLSLSVIDLVQKEWIAPITDTFLSLKQTNTKKEQFHSNGTKRIELFLLFHNLKAKAFKANVLLYAKKITKYFKDIMSKPTNYGRLQIFKYSQKYQKWNSTYDQPMQAEPTHLTWNSKASTLVVGTTIGIYLYSISQNQQSKGEYAKIELIDFVQLPGITSFQYEPRTAQVYILSDGINHKDKGKLSVYSMKKQTIIDQPFKLISPSALIFQKLQKRLFISDQKGIHILHVPQVQNLAQFQYKHIIQCKSQYEQLCFNTKPSSNEKPQYLFGLSKKGFITVFELKPSQKQNLMVALTNIQCACEWKSIQIIWSRKLFASSNRDKIVLIDMQNRPLWVWNNQQSNNKSEIKKIIFDQQNSRILVCNNQRLMICQVQF